MRKKLHSFVILIVLCASNLLAQLTNVKLILPKEINYNLYNGIVFFNNSQNFAICSDVLTVYNTETTEAIDETSLESGAKNLSVNSNGNLILVSIDNKIEIYEFTNQKLSLQSTITSTTLLNGLENAGYYSSLPITSCFFTSNSGIFASIGAFTVHYDIVSKKLVSSKVFNLSDYILSASYYKKTNTIILAKSNGTVQEIVRQEANNLTNSNVLMQVPSTIVRAKVKDSLLFCFASTGYLTINLITNKVVHEINLPKYNYSYIDKKTLKDINKRTNVIAPDTINFKSNEYVYDIDFLSGTNNAIFCTTNGVKLIDLKSKKLVAQYLNYRFTNVCVNNNSSRLLANSFHPFKSLKILNPINKFQVIAEKQSFAASVSGVDVSPNKRWMFITSGSSATIWNLTNFTKHATLKDISNNDTSFIYGSYFINDSEVVVNSGKSFQNLGLHIYNLSKKKYTSTLKKNVYAFVAGFLNNEFYYSDYNKLCILNLRTKKEESYPGMFGMAALNPANLIVYNDSTVFVPKASGFEFLNRKTKKPIYENPNWANNSKVILSKDKKFVFTSANIKKKINISGTEVEMDVYAIVKINIKSKNIEQNYAISYNCYDFKLLENESKIGIWYSKQNYDSASSKNNIYSEYDIETGKELVNHKLVGSDEIYSFKQTSNLGNYIALSDVNGNNNKVYDTQGNVVVDLSPLKIFFPKFYYINNDEKLIVSGSQSSLLTFVDLKNKKIIGQFANGIGDNFFMLTQDLNYMGSKEFIKNMRFKYDSEILNFDQFDAYLNQPHKVLKEFGCSDTLLLKAYENAYNKRLKVLGLSSNAKINFSSKPKFQKIQLTEIAENKVSISLVANKGISDLKELEVYNNGVTVVSEIIPSNKNKLYEKTIELETVSGINRFEFLVKDETGGSSAKVSRFYNNTKVVKPNLYLVVMASEQFENKKFDLSYAVKDASDIAKTMVNSKAFSKIQVKKIINKSFSNDSITNLNKFFESASINDVVMVFFAGHGYLDEDFNYYFPTYYTDFSDPKTKAIPFTSFEKILGGIKPTRKLMFIDACFSGEVDLDAKEGDQKNNSDKKERSTTFLGKTYTQSTALEMSKIVFSDIRKNSGTTIISSAGGTEAAFEGEDWNNGLFTYCLLSGLKNLNADSNADKIITLNELQKYVSEQVNKLSNGAQTPTYRVENSVADYELWKED